MKMTNSEDKQFLASIGSGYLDESGLRYEEEMPMIKIFTKKSSASSRSRYYAKVKTVIGILAKPKPKPTSMLSFEYYDPFQGLE